MEQAQTTHSDSLFDWYKLARGLVGIYVHTLIRKIQIYGEELIPSGPKIIVANHANLSDCFVLPQILTEKLHFLVQADIFSIPIIGKLLGLADQIPTQKGSSREALRKAQKWLERGNSIVVYPEGRMNNGGELYQAGLGAAMLATRSNVPLVPMGFFVPNQYTHIIKSKYQNRPSYGSFQFGGTCYIQVGKPQQIPRFNKTDNTRTNLREATNQLMGCIAELIDMARQIAGYPPLSS